MPAGLDALSDDKIATRLFRRDGFPTRPHLPGGKSATRVRNFYEVGIRLAVEKFEHPDTTGSDFDTGSVQKGHQKIHADHASRSSAHVVDNRRNRIWWLKRQSDHSQTPSFGNRDG
jgi:hypothetical protein